jgi:hypothetical protein
MWYRMGLLAIVTAVACTACGGGSNANPTADGTPTTSSPAPAFPDVPTADGCAVGYAQLDLIPETVYEQWLASSLRVCVERVAPAADGSSQFSLEVNNAGPGVWVLDGIPGWNADARDSGPMQVVLFRHASAGTYLGLAVEPGQSAFATVGNSFSPRLHLDIALQAEWEVMFRSLQAIQDRTKVAIGNQLSPGAAKAVFACGQAAYASAQSLMPINGATSGSALLEKVFAGSIAATNCRQAIQDAADAAKATDTVTPLALSDFKVAAFDGAGDAEAEESVLVSAVKVAEFLMEMPK